VAPAFSDRSPEFEFAADGGAGGVLVRPRRIGGELDFFAARGDVRT